MQETDKGRCVNCGFLGKLRRQIDAECIVYPANAYDRENGTFWRCSGWPHERDIPTQITCFRNAANLRKEVTDALDTTTPPNQENENKFTLSVINKPRKCESWYQWTEYRTPKEHFEEYKMLQLEQNRRDFETNLFNMNHKLAQDSNKVMLRLTIAAIILAIAQVVVAVIALRIR